VPAPAPSPNFSPKLFPARVFALAMLIVATIRGRGAAAGHVTCVEQRGVGPRGNPPKGSVSPLQPVNGYDGAVFITYPGR